MEQGALNSTKPRLSKLALISFILSFFPFLGIVGALVEDAVSQTMILSGRAFPLWILFPVLNIISWIWVYSKKKYVAGIGFAQVAMFIGLILYFCLFWFMQNTPGMIERGKWSNLKSIAFQVQSTVEEYKVSHQGMRPNQFSDFERNLPEMVRITPNPYNRLQYYTIVEGGLIDGLPKQPGQIGYVAADDTTEPYEIVAYPKSYFSIYSEKDTFRIVEGRGANRNL